MPRNVTLPDAAREHMSDRAKQNLPDHVRSGGPYVLRGTDESDTLVGHTGEIDYFVFQFEPNLANLPNDVVQGYEHGTDVIVFENYPDGSPLYKPTYSPSAGDARIGYVTVEDVPNTTLTLLYSSGDFVV